MSGLNNFKKGVCKIRVFSHSLAPGSWWNFLSVFFSHHRCCQYQCDCWSCLG